MVVPAIVVLPVLSPATINLSVSTAIPPLAFNNPVSVVALETSRVVIDAPPLAVRRPVNVVVPPTFRFLAIPTPPDTTSAPFAVVVD